MINQYFILSWVDGFKYIYSKSSETWQRKAPEHFNGINALTSEENNKKPSLDLTLSHSFVEGGNVELRAFSPHH